MALLDNILNIGADAMAAEMKYASIHTATPDSSGSNESTAARQLIDWAEAADGDLALASDLEFTGGASGGDAKVIGFWSASTGGTFYGFFPLSGDQSFNSAGELTIPSGTISGSSS